MDDVAEREVALITLYKTARRVRYASLVGLLVFAGLSLTSLVVLGRGVPGRLVAPALVIGGVALVWFWSRFRRADERSLDAERTLAAFMAEREDAALDHQGTTRN